MLKLVSFLNVNVSIFTNGYFKIIWKVFLGKYSTLFSSEFINSFYSTPVPSMHLAKENTIWIHILLVAKPLHLRIHTGISNLNICHQEWMTWIRIPKTLITRYIPQRLEYLWMKIEIYRESKSDNYFWIKLISYTSSRKEHKSERKFFWQ